jgi:3-keto-5-aminohexanoate cleavage enzyme
MDSVRWDVVEKALERARHRLLWRPYGLPEIVDPSGSVFFEGKVSPRWDVPDRMIVSSAITGAFFTRTANPHQPVTPKEIYEQARDCLLGGASTVHIHVRDDNGYNTLSIERFREVIEPLKDEFPDLAVDGCLVTALDGEWDEMKKMLKTGLLDMVPINTTATYTGDALFAKPVPVILEKTRLVQEAGAKPLISVYTDGDIYNAGRYLFDSGLVAPGAYWGLLPAIPGCSPMENPMQMADGLLRMVRLIRDVDPTGQILVCAAGRASLALVTMAASLGLHIRVGMEDTVWLWPHSDEKVESNRQALDLAQQLAAAVGRPVASRSEYRQILGLPQREPVAV